MPPVANPSATKALLGRLHHKHGQKEQWSGFTSPSLISRLQNHRRPCHHTHRAEEDDSSEEPLAAWKSCPSRRRQGVWERSLCEAVRLMTHSRLCHILSVRRPGRKTASAQSPERSRALDLDGLPSSGTWAAPRGHGRDRGRCSVHFRTAPKGWEAILALLSQTSPLWLSLVSG